MYTQMRIGISYIRECGLNRKFESRDTYTSLSKGEYRDRP